MIGGIKLMNLDQIDPRWSIRTCVKKKANYARLKT